MLIIHMQVQDIEPLFPAVYGPDVHVDLAGPDAGYELSSVLKQAHCQLASADSSEAALVHALATIVVAEDAANVRVDTGQVSEALEEPLRALVDAWRGAWAALAEERGGRAAALAAAEAERGALVAELEARRRGEATVVVRSLL
jgi:hypothetical protein